MSSSYGLKKINNYNVLLLNYFDADNFSELVVLPRYGANILRFSYNGKIIIDYDTAKLENEDFTGTPILFPTPNRVRNSEVVFRGKAYPQIKNGKVRRCHGLVFDEPFEVEKITCNEDKAQVRLSLLIDKNNDIFNAFPFECKLSLVYELSRNGLKIQYSLENLSDASIPYGFGIHPYFAVNGNEKLTIPAEKFLEAEDCFPTGNVIDAQIIIPDSDTKGVIIDNCVLDTDFIRSGDRNVNLLYTYDDMLLTIKSSGHFKHIVIYRPENSKFICIEPQTCSVDAHYMSSKGFKYSDLQWVNKGQSDCGTVEILIDKGLGNYNACKHR